jgi:hypothetical protein
LFCFLSTPPSPLVFCCFLTWHVDTSSNIVTTYWIQHPLLTSNSLLGQIQNRIKIPPFFSLVCVSQARQALGHLWKMHIPGQSAVLSF